MHYGFSLGALFLGKSGLVLHNRGVGKLFLDRCIAIGINFLGAASMILIYYLSMKSIAPLAQGSVTHQVLNTSSFFC